MAILYLETNFLIAVAKGHDHQTGQVLTDFPPDSRMAIPSICFMEALKAYHSDQRKFNKTLVSLNPLIDDATRDKTSRFAVPLVEHLEGSKTTGGSRFNDIQTRLYDVMRVLSNSADWIELTAESLQSALDFPLVKDPADALILSVILEHAQRHSEVKKAFLSGNTNDFKQEIVILKLRLAGIKYFGDPISAMGWLQSSPRN